MSENLRIPKGFRLKAQGWRAASTLGRGRHTAQPQRGCGPTKHAVATPLGLKPIPARFPRVARSSPVLRSSGPQSEADLEATAEGGQPWALFRNPFGIRQNTPSNLWVMTRPLYRLGVRLDRARQIFYAHPCRSSGRWDFRKRELGGADGAIFRHQLRRHVYHAQVLPWSFALVAYAAEQPRLHRPSKLAACQ